MKPDPWTIALILGVGIFALSTGAILIRLAFQAAGVQGVGFSLILAASRLSLAALLLLPAWRNIKPQPLQSGAVIYAGVAGGFLALHFATWITSLSYTSIAASTAIVTTNPVWIAMFSLRFGEKPKPQTLVGITLALIGGLAIGLGGTESSAIASHPLLGNSLALIGSWAISGYLLLGREAQRRGMGIGSYAAIAYSSAALVLLPLPLLWGTSYVGYPPSVYGYVLLMAIGPQLIGHTSFNWALRWISPTLVTLVILFEPVGASILGYFIFGELPGMGVIGGAIVLLIGVAIAALATRPIPAKS
ncbi:DMT family transporter [Phormidium pseudopriestleyi FRX01]|uniref:DMT family transporter n=1 Tax=Phormidium pseudopriestleyi FRX01 TaxID=1759528 RepID=A0ABS3FWK5_9CYAN|nr:DMT family transporter [Phormidium pseudopriestleyi]MBO0351494.1 DMT family transporter [Phormidium pseudopriestleyi FRX01]